ncbi:MAG TPA: hypothetical protein VJP79_09415 [Nitrososphaera sp.]|nr:hypothetical protein [Nitrososphaera sp.]
MSFASAAYFQESTSERIIGIERLAELSSVDTDVVGLRISEIEWSRDGRTILFDTAGEDNIHHLWRISLFDGKNSSEIEKVDFPYSKFSEVYGYQISSNDELLFAAIPEYNGSDIDPGPANLYKIRLGEEGNFTRLTHLNDSSSYIANFDWMADGANIVYETQRGFYPEDPNEPIELIRALWITERDDHHGMELLLKPRLLWNGTESELPRSMDASPDGNYLAFGGDTRLVVFDMASKTFADIVTKEQWNATGIYPGAPKWSANGEYIVYWQTDYYQIPSSTPLFPNDNITTWLRIASPDGLINEAVFQNPGPISSHDLPAAGISPDGRFIAVAVPYAPENYGDDDDIGYGGVYLITLGSHVIPEYPIGITILTAGALSIAALMTRLGYRLQGIRTAAHH